MPVKLPNKALQGASTIAREHPRSLALPRVGLLSLYFGLYDEQMPPGFQVRQAETARGYVERLSRWFEVVYPGLVASEADAARANAVFRAQPLDAVVLAPCMVAPPSYGMQSLDAVDAPMVVWNAPSIRHLGVDIDHADATAHTTQVGCVMLANALIRTGRPIAALTVAPDDERALERLVRTVRAASATSALRRSSALRIGDPIPGYLDVEATTEDLAQLGVSESVVPLEELNDTFRHVSDEDVHALLADLATRGWDVQPDDNLERSARLAIALSSLVETRRVCCGTVNCHGPYFRWNDLIGIPACLGVSLLAERGIGISCTGDQPTAIALHLAHLLSGRALYCEFYAPELDTGLMLLAAGGEGDPGWADPVKRVIIEPNHHYPGQHGEGAAVVFHLQPGPATVLSLSPTERGWRLVWATGEIVETRYPRMGGPNAMFRFDSGASDDAGARWIESGATHHNALAMGRLDQEIPLIAMWLGIESTRV